MKLKLKKKIELEQRIRLLLFAGLDWCVNNEKDETEWFAVYNPYYCEAHGILHCLQVLEWMDFGPVNMPYNLSSWMDSLKQQVKEEGIRLGPSESYYAYKAYLQSLNKLK